jgi:hypothetical protein
LDTQGRGEPIIREQRRELAKRDEEIRREKRIRRER